MKTTICCMLPAIALIISVDASAQKLRPLNGTVITKDDTLPNAIVMARPLVTARTMLNWCSFENKVRVLKDKELLKIEAANLVRLEIIDFAGDKRIFVNPAVVGFSVGAVEALYEGKVAWYKCYATDYYSLACNLSFSAAVKGTQQLPVGWSLGQRKKNLRLLMADCPAIFEDIGKMTMKDDDMMEILRKYERLTAR